MVQLGLCAFRHGNIKEAHNALLDIQSGGRAKELLAQGLLPQRQYERTTEQEKQEKQLPFHQHINLEETIHHSDLPTQILYNRTMVQLGLCAFRHGNIKEAHNALLDIQSGGRAKELLAQGLLPQQYERTTEQEKQEKRQQIPFHQHINLEETIHHSDLPTQILYNRTMVQLGLCAFRHGNIKEAHNALLDIQSGGRAKELLAQGLLPQQQYERTTEQEKQEKQQQIPFHQHINLEVSFILVFSYTVIADM
ncbi:uncharacterized protein [Panulirus ornatus]|uniref:uncharacterized protein isoform X3 n=1 Tax=Panulirus ornatus TaxID=150431 RepID=UPI003A865B11